MTAASLLALATAIAAVRWWLTNDERAPFTPERDDRATVQHHINSTAALRRITTKGTNHHDHHQ